MTDVRDCVYDFIKRIDELEEENEQLKKFCEEFNALNVSKENQRLKELLKECSYRIDWCTKTGHKQSDDKKQKLFYEIDEVLNEKI